jgi:hypothetical protein
MDGRRQRCALIKASRPVPAPRGRASHHFGCQRVSCDRISLRRALITRTVTHNRFGTRRMSDNVRRRERQRRWSRPVGFTVLFPSFVLRRSHRMKSASFEKRVGGNGRSSPSSPSNARWSGCRGAGPCQALAAGGGGRKARLYKGQASPATIATGGPMGCDSRPRARAKPLAGRNITHSRFKRAGF